MIRTALTTKVKLELTYREYAGESPRPFTMDDSHGMLIDSSSTDETSVKRPDKRAI